MYTDKDAYANTQLDCPIFDRPSIEDLQSLITDADHPIKIIEESAHRFKDIGTILLSDRKGTKVDNIATSVRNNPVEAVREIYRQWMQEDVNYSWTKLAQCLRRCELNVLASQIEERFSLPSSDKYVSHTHTHSLVAIYITVKSGAYIIVILAQLSLIDRVLDPV